MMKEKVIIDSDWAADEMHLTSVLMAHPQQVEILGATCSYGNVSHQHAYENAQRILHFLKADQLPLFKGAKAPSGRETPLLGDGAHPVLDFLPAPSHHKEQELSAVEFMLKTLREEPADTVTITTSAPLTNVAQALRAEPETMRRVKRIVIMGGCTESMQAQDMPQRKGNITPHAEFNFQQAAADAQSVMESGLPITLLPMNCTHQLTVTPARQQEMIEAYVTRPDLRRALIGTPDIQTGKVKPEEAPQQDRGLLNGPAHMDREKFGCDFVMHDVHCALYILYPDEYLTQPGRVEVKQHDGPLTAENAWSSEQGSTDFTPAPASNLQVATAIKNPDRLFQIFKESMLQVLPPQKTQGKTL